MLRIGLTGGIGSGKTTIARLLSEQGYPVYIADRRASFLINRDPEIHSALVQQFGPAIYCADGSLNKKKLAEIIFNDPTALQKVNATVHPIVLEDFRHWSSEQDKNFVFFESAILFEAGFEACFDFIVCVYASPETRIARVVNRDRISPEEVKKRMGNQWDDETKRRRSDLVIYTDRGENLNRQIEDMLNKIKEQQ